MNVIDFTERVLAAYSKIASPRLRVIVSLLIKHLHACVKEMDPTDQEFEFAWTFAMRMPAITGSERNEFLLLADALGVSQLIEDVNADKPGQPVGFALIGPFLRLNAPLCERGTADFSDDTPGTRVGVSGKVYDFDTKAPIANAALDTWQAATNGLYKNQDKNQPD